MKLLIINGPGLGDLSDSDRYDGLTLQALREGCEQLCKELQVDLDFRQTDDQKEMIRWMSEDSANFDSLVINPIADLRAASVESGFYRAAMQGAAQLKKPVIEVHISNIYRQGIEIAQPLHEPDGDMGFICGFGLDGYLLAINASDHRWKS